MAVRKMYGLTAGGEAEGGWQERERGGGGAEEKRQERK